METEEKKLNEPLLDFVKAHHNHKGRIMVNHDEYVFFVEEILNQLGFKTKFFDSGNPNWKFQPDLRVRTKEGTLLPVEVGEIHGDIIERVHDFILSSGRLIWFPFPRFDKIAIFDMVIIDTTVIDSSNIQRFSGEWNELKYKAGKVVRLEEEVKEFRIRLVEQAKKIKELEDELRRYKLCYGTLQRTMKELVSE